MKALLLVGGFGTRLRPLTFEVPKPMVEFANKPIVEHQIEALVSVGVKEIILGVGFQSERMRTYVEELGKRLGVSILVSMEKEPMGTAGPLKLAESHLAADNPEGLFFVCNSDVICDFPLKKMLDFHKSHGAEGTILLTTVEDPSKYGVVLSDATGQIQSFVEKPQHYIGNKINAGIYLFNTDILKRISLKPTSIEREIFPKIAEEKKLYSMDLEGFWMDIGQPKDFLSGLKLYLNFLKTKNSPELATGANIHGNVIIHPEAKVSPDAVIGPNVSIGKGCVIESGVRLQNSCIMHGASVHKNSWISGTIVGWRSEVGKWVRIEGVTVIAGDCKIGDEIFIHAAMILPNKEVKTSLSEKGQIIM
jgi:mannose-1-phosphate guanylyltransferase